MKHQNDPKSEFAGVVPGGARHVVVIGGGIVGAYAAYFLADAGMEVTLLDRFPVASKASGCNPGGLNPLHGPGLPGVMSPLAERAYRLNLSNWERVRALSGREFSPHLVSRVELAFDAGEKASLQATIPHYDTIEGFSARWMDRDELLALDPRINPEVTGGLWTEGNGMVNSREYTRAVADAAAALGATIRQADVRGLAFEGNRVTGVVLEDETLACDDVIIASGAWAAEAGSWLDARIPVSPLKGELLTARLAGNPAGHHVTWKMIGVYQTPEGDCWFGGTQEQAGFDDVPTEHGKQTIMDAVSRLIPEARHAEITGHQSGLRPVTPDGLPIIDRVTRWQNAYLATGSGPKGMLVGSGMAEAVVRLATGCQPPFDLSPYRLDRFPAH